MSAVEPDTVVDARGTLCPEPALRARRALDAMQPGQRLLLRATDPHAAIDLEVLCRRFGHRIEAHRQQADEHHFVIVRGSDAA